MNELNNALLAKRAGPVLSGDEAVFAAAEILELAAELERRIEPADGRQILLQDLSVRSLIAWLAIAERRDLQLILGRPSVSIEELHPDFCAVAGGDLRVCDSRARVPEKGGGVFLLTSGTTGTPKVVHQTLPALLGRVRTASLDKHRDARWLLTFESHSFAGLQVVLSAALSGSTLVVAEDRRPAPLVSMAHREAVTHISGTPTFWRAFLMALDGRNLASLRQVTIGGEAVDQTTLDLLTRAFPAARISHIYASTEAGALFSVHDGRAGFPSAWLEQELPGGVLLRVRGGALETLSPRRMVGYASGQATPLTEDGWLATGDLVHVGDDRVIFQGRLDNVVNIAGLKVSPEEVETFLLGMAAVADARVCAVRSPLTGALLAAEIVIRPGLNASREVEAIRAECARALPRHKIPRRFEIVENIPVTGSGKKALVR